MNDLEQTFYKEGYRIASENYDAADPKKSLLNSLEILYEVLESFLEAFNEQISSAGTTPHCKSGCSWCCHQSVFAQEYEFRFLKSWMFSNLDASRIEEIRQKARAKLDHTKNLNKEQKLIHKEACPLLLDNKCSAYEARPVSCRIWLSMSVKSCENEYHNPEDSSVYPELFDLPLRAGRNLNLGFSAYIREKGGQVQEYAVEEGLLLK